MSLEGVALPRDILGCDPIGESSFLFFPCGITLGGMAGWEREEVTNVGVDGAMRKALMEISLHATPSVHTKTNCKLPSLGMPLISTQRTT